MTQAAKDAAASARGEHLPGAVLHVAPDVRAIRARLKLTQPAFAKRFGLPVGTVRDWEQGRTVLDQAARVRLRVIEAEPGSVARVMGGSANRAA